jgi:signal transduction histidine kinase
MRIDGRYVVTIIAIAIAYYTAGRFGQSLAFTEPGITALWPPTGIALAALILWGYRVWPGIFIGALITNALSNHALVFPALISVGNVLGPVLTRFALGRFGFDKAFASMRDVVTLIAFGVLGMVVTASNGVAMLGFAGAIPWSKYGTTWKTWWFGDVMGVIVFAPLILGWAARPQLHWSRSRVVEFGASFGGLVLVSMIALAGQFFELTTSDQLEYAIFPFIIWVSLRFEIREITTAISLMTGFAAWGATHDRGPFMAETLDQRLILLQMFIAIASVTGYTLSAISGERTRARAALQHARDELEVRVQQRTEELAETNAMLAQRNEEVEAFVYIVSHDLRVPLVNLQGFSKELERSCRDLENILQATPLPENNEKVRAIIKDDIADALRYISASTVKFQRLIDALLLLSRTGKQELRYETIDVRGVVDTTILSLHQSIESSGAEIAVDPLPPVAGDVTAIGQVFANLISNALKYLQPGRPGRIRIAGESQGEDVHYEVSDNGAGIPASSQRRLFQVFQRFHPELAPGEGMGLAIVKRVVERHGGKVWANSQEGVGTTFHVTLPASIAKRKDSHAASHDRHGG